MATVRRLTLVRIAFVLVVYLIIEGVSFAGLQVLRRARGLTFFPAASNLTPVARKNIDLFLAPGSKPAITLDPELGWIRSPGPTNNAGGMRDNRDYAPQPDSGVLRIAAFGESFTYGSDVELGESWAKQISAIDPHIEVLNYGIAAYGLDQAYLRYLKLGADYHPHIVLIGYMSENIARNVNVFRGFYTKDYPGWTFTKPRFRLENGKLVLLPNPLRSRDDYRRFRDDERTVLREIGRNDYHYVAQYGAGPFDFSPTVRLVKMVAARVRHWRQVPILTRDGRYNEQSEAYAVTVAILDSFYRKALEAGALPIILVFPDLGDQHRSRDGKPRRYSVLLDDFKAKGYRYIDVMDALEPVQKRYSISDLSVKWGHYSPLGNEIIARHILESLHAWNLDDIAGVKAATVSERTRLGR